MDKLEKLKKFGSSLSELEEDILNINRTLSICFITSKKQLTEKNIFELNKRLGEWIQKIRQIRTAQEEKVLLLKNKIKKHVLDIPCYYEPLFEIVDECFPEVK